MKVTKSYLRSLITELLEADLVKPEPKKISKPISSDVQGVARQLRSLFGPHVRADNNFEEIVSNLTSGPSETILNVLKNLLILCHKNILKTEAMGIIEIIIHIASGRSHQMSVDAKEKPMTGMQHTGSLRYSLRTFLLDNKSTFVKKNMEDVFNNLVNSYHELPSNN